MEINGLLLAGIFAVSIASSLLAFAPWVAVGIYVVAIVLLLTSIVRNAPKCAAKRSSTPVARA